MKQALLTAIICLTLLCCKKHTTAALKADWPCDIILDSITIANGLAGTWTWTKVTGGDGKIRPADKAVKVTFNTNATFTVQENGAIITQGTWKLEASVSSQWQLNLSAPSWYLQGWAGVCVNQIGFFDGYVDGPDNYFEKAE